MYMPGAQKNERDYPPFALLFEQVIEEGLLRLCCDEMEIGHICAKSIFWASRQWDIRQNRAYFRRFALLFRQSYEFIRQAHFFVFSVMGYPPKSEVFPPFCIGFPPKL